MTPIVFLIVDCLRADRAFGQADLAPDGFLARLRSSGFTFENAVTVTPTTTPAVATMLTGCYPFEHGLRGLKGFRRASSTPTLASALGEAGYRTEASVAGPLQPELELFDEFDDYGWSPGSGSQASLHGPRGEQLAQRVRDLRRGGQPWFLLFHVWDLHEPRQVPVGWDGPALSSTVYDRALAALDARLAELLPAAELEDVVVCLVGDHGENLRFEPRGKVGRIGAGLLWWRPTRWAVQPFTKRLIELGAHSRSKRALRLAPRALITHGHHLFEPLLRVPYMLAGPSIAPGTSAALVTHTDLAPTLASFAGAWFQGGVGAVPLPLDGSGDPERHVILETAWVTSLPGVRQIGLRTARWKYMELAEGGAPALFDLEADPGERRNVVAKHSDVANLFADELRAAFAGEVVGERMSEESSALVEQRLRDLGYFD
jgi:arylsulfatase A-like enzyme